MTGELKHILQDFLSEPKAPLFILTDAIRYATGFYRVLPNRLLARNVAQILLELDCEPVEGKRAAVYDDDGYVQSGSSVWRFLGFEEGQHPLLLMRRRTDDEVGPETRGVVVLDVGLGVLESPLSDRNIRVMVAERAIDDEAKRWLLTGRVFVTENEQAFVDDASSFIYGAVSLRLLSNREPEHVAKVMSDAFARRRLWTCRHGFLLVLMDDGEHLYCPLVD